MRERPGRRMVAQSGHADSQRWVKFGQEAPCGCPKMASPSYSFRLQDVTRESLQMESQSFKERKGARNW